jgi:hypothetical protein
LIQHEAYVPVRHVRTEKARIRIRRRRANPKDPVAELKPEGPLYADGGMPLVRPATGKRNEKGNAASVAQEGQSHEH